MHSKFSWDYEFSFVTLSFIYLTLSCYEYELHIMYMPTTSGVALTTIIVATELAKVLDV